MSREPKQISAAPPLRLEIAFLLGLFATGLFVRYATPWLTEHMRGRQIAECTVGGDLETRLVYLMRRDGKVVAECGPLVGGQKKSK